MSAPSNSAGTSPHSTPQHTPQQSPQIVSSRDRSRVLRSEGGSNGLGSSSSTNPRRSSPTPISTRQSSFLGVPRVDVSPNSSPSVSPTPSPRDGVMNGTFSLQSGGTEYGAGLAGSPKHRVLHPLDNRKIALMCLAGLVVVYLGHPLIKERVSLVTKGVLQPNVWAGVWLGGLCAITFMEAPMRLYATTLHRSQREDLGRLVQWCLQRCELVLAVILHTAVRTHPVPIGLQPLQQFNTALIVLTGLLAGQVFVLQPYTDQLALHHIAPKTFARPSLPHLPRARDWFPMAILFADLVKAIVLAGVAGILPNFS